jgi:ArsR family metal-binding transcriptional regulator
MGIDSESDISASLQIGPTTEGMVRIYVEGDGFSLPLDFDPDEAEEIAEELRDAAERARDLSKPKSGRKGRGRGGRGPKG